MNVAFDASAVLGRSGIERYSRELIRSLLALDEHIAATLISEKGSRRDLISYFGAGNMVDVRDVLSHERLLGAPLRRVMRMVQRRQWDAAASDVDLVHLLGPQKVVPTKRPLVVTIHDLFPMYEAMGIDGSLKSRFPRRIARQLHATSAVLCPSAYVAATVREHFPWYTGPIAVTPLAASNVFTPTPLAVEARERLKLQRPYLLFVGRIDGRKNVDRMLAAWQSLPHAFRSNADFVLILAGGENAVSRFRAQRATVFQDPSLRVLTDVSTPDMVQVLSSAQALVFATLGEGFGLPVIEAMKCGCPVITSGTTSLPEVGGDAALYVDPLSIEEIAVAMKRCLEDDDLTSAMRQRGLQQAATFGWDITARATFAVYRTIVG